MFDSVRESQCIADILGHLRSDRAFDEDRNATTQFRAVEIEDEPLNDTQLLESTDATRSK
ncbi:hypothetical protein [Haladaptatus halobius]|uniref:hypothetical protein n=1 Tax=Haladaptatus halobius TaxID=2884875 RepID=UPI001D0AA0A1|nr:hypothetical protein [Haladaptatus halobius]